jgi:glucokinase
MILAGDVGGTKTRLALVDPEEGPRKVVAEQTIRSASYDSLEEMVANFLQRHGGVEAACFGVAGPVIDGHAKVTNLMWDADAASLREHCDIGRVLLVNDLVATASSIPHLQPDELHELNPGKADPHGTIGVLAPGTGLGEAYLVWDGTRHRPLPSEGGHCSFAPRDQTEIDLLTFLSQRFDHISYERVCSGSGIQNLYSFFRHRDPDEELPDVAAAIDAAEDPTPIIVESATSDTDHSPVCRRTVRLFVSILGGEAGNLALKLLSTGGIYLGGGIPPRIVPLLDKPLFLSTYTHKGRFGELTKSIPVRVILRPDAALIGAAAEACALVGAATT